MTGSLELGKGGFKDPPLQRGVGGGKPQGYADFLPALQMGGVGERMTPRRGREGPFDAQDKQAQPLQESAASPVYNGDAVLRGGLKKGSWTILAETR